MKKHGLLITSFLIFFLINSEICASHLNTYATVLDSNLTSEVSIKTSKDTYTVNEPITVIFSGLPGNTNDWITLIKPSASAKDYGNWKYTKGKTNGSLSFDGMQEGNYEVRVYFSTDYTIQARYPFKVVKSTKVATLEEKIESSPAYNQIQSLIERLDKIEKLKNAPDWGSEQSLLIYKSFLETAPIHLEQVKTRDPNFDVSAYQKRLDDYQSYYDNNLEQVTNNNVSKAAFEKAITDKSWKLSKLMDEKLGSGAGWVHSYFNTANYLKEATDMDYPALLKMTTEGDNKYNVPNLDYKITSIKEFGGLYKLYYDETLDNLINELIETAYENKTKNAQDAIKYAEQAKQLSDAALLILPNDSAIRATNKLVATSLAQVGGAVFAKVYTSDFHKKNVEKVVFFSKKPKIKSENNAMPKSLYKAGDFIYAMAYLKGSFKDLTKATNSISITTNIYVDGSKKTDHTFTMDWNELQKDLSYLFIEVVPDPVTNQHSGPAKYAQKLASISPRNHTIRLSIDAVQPGTSHKIHLAEGEFNLDCSTGQEKLANYAVIYREKALSSIFMPKASMSNSNLVNSMKSALQNEGWENDKKIQRVVITGSNWTVYKHPVNGKILYKSIPAAVAFKTNEGYCKYWNLTFKQHYNGTSYGNPVVGGVGSIVDLSCKNVFK